MVEPNEKYGKLTTLYVVGRTKNRNKIWRCQCECGNLIDVSTGSLTSGNTKSCGCLHKESLRKYGKEHRLLNKYNLDGEYGIGYTSKGEEFYFDLEDYDLIRYYTWRLNESGYVVSMPYRKTIRMHMIIMHSDGTFDVDHRNHITYDNRKSNLRIIKHHQNVTYSKKYSNNSSGHKGVSFDKSRNKWIAYITFNKKNYNLGRYDKYEDAVIARENAEKEIHKEFHFES